MTLIKITRDFNLLILSLAIVLFAQISVHSQNEKSNQDKNQESIIRIDSTLVNVPTIVSDRDGRYVTNLKKEDFQLFENEIEQEIAFFQPVEQPFTVLLLLDVSGSMYNDFANINNASNIFLNQLRPHDYLSAAAFDDSVPLPFVQDLLPRRTKKTNKKKQILSLRGGGFAPHRLKRQAAIHLIK
jgi:hypothetical protein